MKKMYIIKKVVISIMLISIIIAPTYVQAGTIGEVISDGDSFLEAVDRDGSPVGIPVDGAGAATVSSNIYNLFLGVAIVIAVCLAAYLGVQYMVSSAMDKAKVKESFLALALGCIVAFGAFGIWKVLVTMLGKI